MDKSVEMFFDSKGQLINIPKKTGKKMNVLKQVLTLFERDRDYSELEVNHILKGVYDDPIYLRRLLIEAQLLKRLIDGSKYWVSDDENRTQC